MIYRNLYFDANSSSMDVFVRHASPSLAVPVDLRWSPLKLPSGWRRLRGAGLGLRWRAGCGGGWKTRFELSRTNFRGLVLGCIEADLSK